MSLLEAGPSTGMAMSLASPTSEYRPTPKGVGNQVLQGLPDMDSDSDSDHDEGVFFGSFRPVEEKVVAVLSTNRSQNDDEARDASLPPPEQAQRQFRDFTRRKTMLLSDDKENVASAASGSPAKRSPDRADEDEQSPCLKAKKPSSPSRPRTPLASRPWENRFKSPRRTLGDITQLFTPSPITPRVPSAVACSPDVGSEIHPSDLTLDFANFRLSDSPVSPPATALKAKKTKKTVGFAKNVNVRWYSRITEPPLRDESSNEEDAVSESSELSDSDEDDFENPASYDDEDSSTDLFNDRKDREHGQRPGGLGPMKEDVGASVESASDGDPAAFASDCDATSLENEIDMGGLRLSDLGDPDEGFESQYGAGSLDRWDSAPSSIEESSDVPPADCEPELVEEVEADQAEQSDGADEVADSPGDQYEGSDAEGPGSDPSAAPLIDDIASPRCEEQDDGEACNMTDSPESQTDSNSTPCPAPLESDGESSASRTAGTPTPLGELDSPMPVARAGPVIIPTMRFSPKAIPFFDDMPVEAEMAPEALGSTADIFAFEIQRRPATSGSLGTPHGAQPTSIKGQYASLGLGVTPSRVTPGRPVSAQMPDFASRGSKLLKSTALLNAAPLSPERPRVVSTAEDKAAALEIRNQLDRIARPAPPIAGIAVAQRSASGSSTASSSSSTSVSAAARVPGRLGMGAPARSGSGSSRPEKASTMTSRPKTVSVAPNRALHKVASRTELKSSVKPEIKPKTGVRPVTVSTAPRTRVEPPSLASARVPQRPVPIASSISRPGSALGKPVPTTVSAGGPRTALATKTVSQPSIASRPTAPAAASLKPQPAKPLAARVPLGNARIVPAAASPVEVASNPLKRSFATMQPAPARTVAVSTAGGPARPTMGPPSRMFEPAVAAVAAPIVPSLPAQVPVNAGFSLGVSVPEAPWSASRGMFRSPARATIRRTGGTPSKPAFLNLGTPSRRGEKPAPKPARGPAALLFPAAAKPAGTTENVPPSKTAAPGPSTGGQASDKAVASPTRKTASGPSPPDKTAQRGSSADYEEVSFAIPQAASSDQGSSPTPSHAEASSLPKQSTSSQDSQTSFADKVDRSGPSSAPGKIPSPSRPKRAIKPPQTLRGRVDLRETIVPNMSEKQLKAITAANTAKNEVYNCAIDRQIIRRAGPRPPSPGGRMRSSIDRDEDDQKKGRGDRAKKRAGEEVEEKPVIEVVARPLGPGDEEEWSTPPRAAKKMRVGADDAPAKSVRWDKGVVIVRDDGERLTDLSELDPDKVGRGNLRHAKVQLDQHGNLADSASAQDKLKKTKVLVTAVFYDGEEPVPVVAPSTATRSKKK